MSVEEDGVVAHQGCHHEQHLELIIHTQEDGTGDQPQDAAVYKVLEQGNTSGKQRIYSEECWNEN